MVVVNGRVLHRRWPALLVAILLATTAPHALIARAQTTGTAAQDPSDARLVLLLEQLRATPADERTLAQGRALGFEFIRAGRFEEAVRVFGAVREASPQDQTALYGEALALFNLRRIDESETLARAAAEKALSLMGSKKTSGRAGGQGESTQALAVASDAFVLLGVILAVRKDDAGALTAVRRAVELTPGSFDAQFALGRALYGAGDPSAAVRAFQAALTIRPSDARARFFLATSLEAAGDDDGALAAYREVARLSPQAVEGHLGAGVLLVKRGGSSLAEGIAELEKALSTNPDLYEARMTLGRALIRTGRAVEAVTHLKRAVELAPQNPEPHYQLALAYRRLNRKEEARAEDEVVKRLHDARRRPAAEPRSVRAKSEQQ